MNTHSFGHGYECHYCGSESDDGPCDGSVRPHPTAEQLAEYEACRDLGEKIENIGFQVGNGFIDYDAALVRFLALRPGGAGDQMARMRLMNAAPALADVLLEIEWSRPCETRHYIGPLDHWTSCPSCRGYKPHHDPRVTKGSSLYGHKADCKLFAALWKAGLR